MDTTLPNLKTLNTEELESELSTGKSIIQLKRDGHCLFVNKDADGAVQAYTRRPTDITAKVNFLLGAVYRLVPNNTQLVGELWLPGGDSSYIKAAINSRDPKLRFDVFAVRTMDAEANIARMSPVVESWGLTFVPTMPFKGSVQDLIDLEVQDFDVEGYVIKRGNLVGWSRWKPVYTIDLVISGFTEGRAANIGLVGAIKCKTSEGIELADVGGMTAKQRVDFSFEPKKYIGEVVEVEYTSVTRYGRLRHPRFKRVRDDKQPTDCGLSQDPRLQAWWTK